MPNDGNYFHSPYHTKTAYLYTPDLSLRVENTFMHLEHTSFRTYTFPKTHARISRAQSPISQPLPSRTQRPLQKLHLLRNTNINIRLRISLKMPPLKQQQLLRF